MAKAHRRYTEQERARILTAAAREGLSGPKAAKKFGISTLTFYNWRKRAGAPRGQVSASIQLDGSLAGVVRAHVQAKVRELLPGIVREEVDDFVAKTLGVAHKRGRNL